MEDDVTVGDAIVSLEPVCRQQRRSNIFFAGCFAMTIAAVLGTGILRLPVKLSKSGLTPFLATFALCLVNQILVVYYMLEILQRARAVMICQRQKERIDLPHLGPSRKPGLDDSDGFSTESSSRSRGPDLHLIGQLFLPTQLRGMYNVAVMLHFISILISYALAASEAYGQLLHIPRHVFLIPPFVVGGTLLIIFARRLIQPLISIFTFFKGALLLILVAVCSFVGYRINQHAVDRWQAIGQPFLFSTVALGGVVNVLPVMYAKVSSSPSELRKLRASVVSGLFTVWFLNVLWCFAALSIVPQSTDDATHVSLDRAESRGEMSTVPILEIIRAQYPSLAWIVILVSAFIVLSISASYLTLGYATKHTLDGFAASMQSCVMPSTNTMSPYPRKLALFCAWTNPDSALRGTLYATTFGLVLAVATINPRAFLMVLEVATSVALNLESGVFVTLMLSRSRANSKSSGRHHPSLSLPPPTRPDPQKPRGPKHTTSTTASYTVDRGPTIGEHVADLDTPSDTDTDHTIDIHMHAPMPSSQSHISLSVSTVEAVALPETPSSDMRNVPLPVPMVLYKALPVVAVYFSFAVGYDLVLAILHLAR